MTAMELALRLVVAAGLGAVLGIEREYHQKPVGLRTNMLIALGSALFTIASLRIGGAAGSPDRIAAQIVTGVGFLGGGAILRSGTSVHGMTTAAAIWVNAAVGVAAGAGDFAIAATATALTLAILIVLPPIESYFARRADKTPPIAVPGRK